VLPVGLQFISSGDLINNSGTLAGTIANLPLGATRSLTFQARVTQAGAILNKAEVSKSDQFDPDSQPNTGTEDGQDDTGGVLIGGQQADLSLTKTVNNTSPNVGDQIIYTINVVNAGPSTATNVEVKDVLPAGLQFISSSDFQLSGSTLTSQIASLPVGNKTLTFTAKVTGNQSITNKTEISKSDQFDPDSQVNTGTQDGQDDTDSVRVTPRIADLSLEKLVSKTNPNVGETITYTIKVKNAGPDNATNVQVKDLLPAGLQFISSADFSNTSGLLLSNNINSVTSGGEVNLTFQAKVTQSGAILNKAEVSKSDVYDSDSQPNTGTEDGQDDTGGVLIGGQQADLSLTKAVSNTTPNVGDNIIYTIVVTNAGPSTATNVEVLDILPAGLQFISSTDFTNTSGTLTGQILSLPVGSPKP
jgi:large repetitive protein